MIKVADQLIISWSRVRMPSSLLDSLVRHCQVVPAPDVPTTDGLDLVPLMEVLDRIPDHRDRGDAVIGWVPYWRCA